MLYPVELRVQVMWCEWVMGEPRETFDPATYSASQAAILTRLAQNSSRWDAHLAKGRASNCERRCR